MKTFAPPFAIVLLTACSAAPVDPALTPVATAGEPPATPVCVVSMDGGAETCTEPLAPVAPPESDEPCVERESANAFTHGPAARLHTFCTPRQSVRKAAEALRRDDAPADAD